MDFATAPPSRSTAEQSPVDETTGRVEAMDWADERDNIDYIFGLAGNAALDALVAETPIIWLPSRQEQPDEVAHLSGRARLHLD